jgi:hypothetical protein
MAIPLTVYGDHILCGGTGCWTEPVEEYSDAEDGDL